MGKRRYIYVMVFLLWISMTVSVFASGKGGRP